MTIGTNDLTMAGQFYDELFAILGIKRLISDDHITIWANKSQTGMFSVVVPNNGKKATVGNGTMVAFAVENLAVIKTMHAKMLSLGGTCEGLPGPRGKTHHFGYARDLEGNKLAFYCPQ